MCSGRKKTSENPQDLARFSTDVIHVINVILDNQLKSVLLRLIVFSFIFVFWRVFYLCETLCDFCLRSAIKWNMIHLRCNNFDNETQIQKTFHPVSVDEVTWCQLQKEFFPFPEEFDGTHTFCNHEADNKLVWLLNVNLEGKYPDRNHSLGLFLSPGNYGLGMSVSHFGAAVSNSNNMTLTWGQFFQTCQNQHGSAWVGVNKLSRS